MIWSINNTAARVTCHFSKEAEIKTNFEVVFCVSVLGFIFCLYLITEICLIDYLSAVLFMFILLTTVKLSKKQKWSGHPPYPYSHIPEDNTLQHHFTACTNGPLRSL